MPKKLLAEALKQLPAKTPKLYKNLLELLSKDISKTDVDFFDPSLLAQMAETHWSLCQKRVGEEGQFRVYCPVTPGDRRRKTVIDIVSHDMAFLVDSVVAEINKYNLLIDFISHPLLYVKRDSKGVLTDLSAKPKLNYDSESHIHIHIRETVSDEILSQIEKNLSVVLRDVSVANRDWRAMLDRLDAARNELIQAKTKESPIEIGQFSAFLSYLYDNNFTLLGYKEYKLKKSAKNVQYVPLQSSGLGLLHQDIKPDYTDQTDTGLSPALQKRRKDLPAVFVSKTSKLATVHRRVPMDMVTIKTFNEKGEVTGGKMFLGLFTSVTYSRSVTDVPYLREKVEQVMTLSEQMPGSHDYKILRHILEKYPRDELFQLTPRELLDVSRRILKLQERQRIALFMRQDHFERYISCLVYVPRDRFGTKLRREMQGILEEELDGTCTNFYTNLDDSVFARVMYIISTATQKQPKYNAEYIEALLQDVGQTWSERLSNALGVHLDDEPKITAFTLKYGEAFPLDYTYRYSARRAISDIKKIEACLDSNVLQLDLYRPPTVEKNQMRLKVYSPSTPLTLSDVMPILAHINLRAISELPFEIKPKGEECSIWIHDFLLEIPHNGDTLNLAEIKPIFENAFSKIWYGQVESDTLNELIISAGLRWAEIKILRAYVRYMKQIGFPFGQAYIEKALTNNPQISRILIELFLTYHDPNFKSDREKVVGEKTKALQRALDQVKSLDEDRVLRSILSLIEASLRTNFFQTTNNNAPKDYLSIKFDCKAIADLPEPKPYREIFVYSPRVEGIHLRGDKIARGGIRWSDRREDFRTEVLGLMKAQMVKNSVIVPMGAKGGFIVKCPPVGGDRQAFFDEGVACYKTLVRGLLDITDNRVGTKVKYPKNVVRRDGDDPYLVVAADKGTATFSDIANGLSQDYGFWLDDAFASGGSAGYDHKKMGITARGGWESVKLHFRHLNHNIQENDFDVIGVGDMGGDVFGNGMLLSKHIRLVGAFNHLHIFCDPDPDPESSFKERDRLFKNVMGWGEYDTKKLSKGGAIFSRADKSLTLTPEIQNRFNIQKKTVSPIELIHAMLKARTDLLWFGGIGTYIKSSSETHQDVGDKANDALRVDATEVQAKVIGEGANLGVTQRARIEFSQRGGRINTDFIDNSGGVDSSDHEVNIKILLTDVMQDSKHKMDLKARNILLEKMTDDVARKVLSNNYQQALAISLAEFQAPERLHEQEEFIQYLEREKGLNRELEGLPSTEETYARLELGKGLTRPELAILVSYAKTTFTRKLLSSDVPDQDYMQGWALRYFPDVLREKYSTEILRHRLKREIIATRVASSIVNRMGPTFITEVQEKTGEDDTSIVKSYILTLEILRLRDFWLSVESLDNKVPATVQLHAMCDMAKVVTHFMKWLLLAYKGRTFTGQDLENYTARFDQLRQSWCDILTDKQRENMQASQRQWEGDGLPKDLAKEMASLHALKSAADIVRTSLDRKQDLFDTAKSYFEIGELFHLDWLRSKAAHIPTVNQWQIDARESLIDGLYDAQVQLTIKALENKKSSSKKGQIVQNWREAHQVYLEQILNLFAKLKNESEIDFAMLTIAIQKLQQI